MRIRHVAWGLSVGLIVAEVHAQSFHFASHGIETGLDAVTGVAIGDLNGDGIDDVCLGSYFGSKVRVQLGDAEGGLLEPSDYPAPSSFGNNNSLLVITDIDHDGKNDLLSANSAIIYLRGDGNGGLSNATNLGFGVGLIVSARVFADVNGDGRGDIVSGGVTSTNAVAVQLATPAGFASPATVALPGQIVSLAVGDWNGDGKADLVTADKLYEQKMRIALGDGAGNFTATTAVNLPGDPGRLGLGDLNGDGRADVAVSLPGSSQIRIYFGTASGAIGASTVLSTPPQLSSARIADVTGDGAADVVAGHSVSGVALPIEVFAGDGHGGFSAPISNYAGSFPTDVIPAHFGGDTLPDLYVPDSLGFLLGRGNGRFGGELFADGSLPIVTNQFAFDWNGDGRSDLLQFATTLSTTSPSGGYVMRFGKAQGGLAAQATTTLAIAPDGDAASGDIDHDGLLDLVVTQNYSNPFAILRAQPNGSFQVTTQSLAISAQVAGLELGDITGDGNLDLVESSSGKLFAAPGDGAGHFQSATATTIAYIGDIVEDDFDLDGDLDVVLAFGGYIVLANQGAGTFQVKPFGLWMGDRKAVALDWNLDGFPDLVGYGDTATTFAPSKLSLVLGNGTLQFLEISDLTCHANQDRATVLDLDGDGRIELMLGTADGAEIVDDDGLGNMHLRKRVIGPPGGHPIAADFDGDSRLDIVLAAHKGTYLLPQIGTPPCTGTILDYGTGCAGSGGIVPQLSFTGCPMAGQSVTLKIEQALGGSTALLLIGAGQGSTQIGACSLLVAPLLPVVVALPLAGSGPGNGSIQLGFQLDATTTATSVALQAVVLDPGVPLGAAFTHAIAVNVP